MAVTDVVNAPPGGAPEDGDACERERRATWFELFCDLVFVAAVGQVTHRLGTAPDARSVLAVAALFLPVWWTWVLYADRANRLDKDNAVDRLLTMTGMAGVCGIAVFIGQVGKGTSDDIGFVLSYLLARWMVTVLYAWAGRGDPRFKAAARSYAACSALSSLLWAGGLALPDGAPRWTAWGAGMLVELALPFLAGRYTAAVPSDADHLTERFGLFTIIMLGEMVLGFVGGLSHTRTGPAAALAGVLAFALCACLWWAYFNASSSGPGSHAQLASRPWLRHAFVYGHLPMQCGLAVLGGTLGVVVSGQVSQLSPAAAACVGGGIAVFHAVGALVRAAFTGFGETVVRIRLAVTAGVLVMIPLAPRMPTTAALGLLALILAVGVLVEQPAHRRRVADRDGTPVPQLAEMSPST
ncbi:low temperature requirement protein A [Streptomyces sp. NPDC089919]|uniref:low temperature requirement protein A n=1 Tax=Streptomyces sp. NPDC089919 TaxID=3155188 RepID=UPI003426323F